VIAEPWGQPVRSESRVTATAAERPPKAFKSKAATIAKDNFGARHLESADRMSQEPGDRGAEGQNADEPFGGNSSGTRAMKTRKLAANGDDKEGSIDPAMVRQIADLLNGTDLTEIEVQKGDLRIRVARAVPGLAPAARVGAAALPSAEPPVEAASEHPGTVKSPMVGTAYRRPSPEAKAFVDIGTLVKAGEKILLIEAMKTFNEIVAPRAGTVTAILVEDNQPVEYDQPLLIIE
jgi:acetyl-CoA carboxylase biotin carboxyl carrier protein